MQASGATITIYGHCHKALLPVTEIILCDVCMYNNYIQDLLYEVTHCHD